MSLITQFMEKSLMISWNFVSRWAACYAMVLGSKPKPWVATYHIIFKQLGDVNDFLYSNDRWNLSVFLQIVKTAKNGPIQLKCISASTLEEGKEWGASSEVMLTLQVFR